MAGFRQRLSAPQFEAWSIPLATHHSTSIDNETGPSDLKPSPQTLQREQLFEKKYGYKRIRPAIGLTQPMMPRNRVDLPAPLGPTTAVSEPRRN